jgi:hypothetical protein
MKVKDIKFDRRTNENIYIMEYNRDGTVDVREYDVKNIPQNELERSVMDICTDIDGSMNIYVI